MKRQLVKGQTGLVLAAAGTGSRFGSETPKQFLIYNGRPVYLRSLDTFVPFVSEAVIVVHRDWVDPVMVDLEKERIPIRIHVEPGGDSRQASVGLGLGQLGPGVKMVLVHDAARPFVSQDLIASVLNCAVQEGACIPVLPVGDTVKELKDQHIVRTIPRESLGLAQTPQAFRREYLEEAYTLSERTGFRGTDEASMVEQLGVRISTVSGEVRNIKVTWQGDLDSEQEGERVR